MIQSYWSFVVYVHICTPIALKGSCSFFCDHIILILLCSEQSERLLTEFQYYVWVKVDCPCDSKGGRVVRDYEKWSYSLIEHKVVSLALLGKWRVFFNKFARRICGQDRSILCPMLPETIVMIPSISNIISSVKFAVWTEKHLDYDFVK